MGLVFLLGVSLTALSRVSLAASSPQRTKLQARENARLGLMQAMGELQRVAGPDRRMTARAEILGAGATAGNRYWTGVWDATQPSENPVWLVSGQAPDPAVEDPDSLVLVPENARAGVPAVRVEKIYFDRGDGSRNAFAWWVGDEGVKASLAAGRETPLGLDDLDEIALRNQTPAGVDLSNLLVPGAGVDRELEAGLKRLASRSALPLLRDAGGPAITGQRAEAAFHDYTPCAYAVLENPLTGGLKVNLSDDDYRDGFVNDALQQFLTPITETPAADLSAHKQKEGQPVHALYPVPTEVVLYMGLFHGWSDGIVRIRYHVEVEFWNPYPVPITFPSDEGDEWGNKNRSIVVVFTGMPEIEIKAIGDSKVPELEDDLDNCMYYAEGSNGRYINGWMDVNPPDKHSDIPVLLPGEVYRVLAPSPDVQPRGVARRFCFQEGVNLQGKTDGLRWAHSRGSRPDYNTEIRVKADHPRGGVDIAFLPFTGEDTDYREEEPFFKIEGLDFDDFKYKQVFRSKKEPDRDDDDDDEDDGYVSYTEKEFAETREDGILPFSIPYPNMDGYKIDYYTIAYHYKLKGDADDLADLLTSLDPRNPVLDCDDKFTDREGHSRRVKELVEAENFTRTDPEDRLVAFDDDELFHDEDGRSHEDENLRQFVAYDLPRTEPVSVGVLRFAQIPGLPALAIGSERAAGFNGVFDYYFMSPLAAPNSPRRLLNPWLEPLERSQWQRDLSAEGEPRQDDAARLCQVGAFNLNSTSVEAWRAVLGASRQAEEETDGGWGVAEDGVTPPAFFRLPFYGAWADDVYGQASDASSLPKAFGSAARALDKDLGEDQIHVLCQGIVDKVEADGPFASVADFLNAGVLQEAIDEVGVTRGLDLPPINANVPAGSNLYLMQGDLMEALAPMLTVRSDTFVIRACGESEDTFTGQKARAWCEATVRRVPEQVDGSDPMGATAVGGLGRRFEIVSFRWLDAAEVEGEPLVAEI